MGSHFQDFLLNVSKVSESVADMLFMESNKSWNVKIIKRNTKKSITGVKTTPLVYRF